MAVFIEIELTDPELLKQHVDAAKPAEKAKLEALRDWFECSYTPLGRSASSEAHLSFLRYRNFSGETTATPETSAIGACRPLT